MYTLYSVGAPPVVGAFQVSLTEDEVVVVLTLVGVPGACTVEDGGGDGGGGEVEALCVAAGMLTRWLSPAEFLAEIS